MLSAVLLLLACVLPRTAHAQGACGEWTQTAIGAPSSGTAQFDACSPGTITITSAGIGSSSADIQYMVQRELCGDGTIDVKVESISNGGRAGLEIRADNAAGAVKAGIETALTPFIFRVFRTATDAAQSQQQVPATGHRWLRLVRSGSNIQLFWSPNGTNWTSAALYTNMALPACARIGIFVESNNAAVATGVFNSLSVSGFTSPGNAPATTFSFAPGSLSAEAGEEVQVCVNIANPCACAPASVQVALQGNAAPHLSGFSTQTLQFQSGDTQKCFDLPTLAASGDGSYTLVLQNPTGGNDAAIGAQSALAVAVTGEPETPTGCPWAGPDREICRGESVVLGCAEEVQPPAGTFYCYKWTPETGLDDPSLPQPTATPQETTTYTLYVTDNKGNLVATDGVLVRVKGSEISIIADKEVLCSGETALLSTEEGLTSYLWSLDGTPIAETTHAVVADVPGRYEVEAIDLDGCEVRAEIIIASSNVQSGLREKFISEGFICIPITILDDEPGILPPAAKAKSVLTMDLVDDFANKNILIEGASELPVNVSAVIENMLSENFLSDYAANQLKGYVTENASLCGEGSDATFEQIRTDFQSKEIGFWFHLWKNPDVEGEDCLLVKAKTPRVPAPGFSPVSEEHSAYIFEIIDLIKQDNPLPGDFSSQGERIVYALCEMLWEGFEIEIAETPDELINELELKIKEQAPPGTMGISQFINLVKAEEAKYPESEQRNTKLMITRLRRIFYNSNGFNTFLIPNAPSVTMVPSPYGMHLERERGRLTVMAKFISRWLSFDIIDTENYPIDPLTDSRPEIYSNQEVRLEVGNDAGLHIDMGHVFAGLDAFNYRSVVAFPNLGFIPFLPDNMSASTWIGDLGSSLAYANIEYNNQGG